MALANQGRAHLETVLAQGESLAVTGQPGKGHRILESYSPRCLFEEKRIISAHLEVCAESKDLEGYFKWNERLLKHKPFDLILWYNREVVARKLGLEEEVRRSAERFLELCPQPSQGDLAAK